MQSRSYYKTIVTSEIWGEWTKYAQDNLLFDMPESIECDLLSQGHWEAFIKWIEEKAKKKLLSNIASISEQIADSAPEGDWYLLPPNATNVVGYIYNSNGLGGVAYKGKPMNIKAVITGTINSAIKKLS